MTVASATFHDETGLVESCNAVPAQPGSAQDQPTVTNPGGDQTILKLLWLGSVCSQPYNFVLRATQTGYALDGTLGPGAVCFAMAPVDLELRLTLRQVVDASTVTPTVTFLRASPSP